MDKNEIQQTIIEELEMGDLPPEKQFRLLARMTESILRRAVFKTLEMLSLQDRDQLKKIQETGDADKTNEFLNSKIPNYGETMRGVIIEFKEEMKRNIEMLKGV